MKKRKNRAWGYYIIFETDTDFKENWVRRVMADLLSAVDNAFDNFSSRANVRVHFEEFTDDDIKDFKNRL